MLDNPLESHPVSGIFHYQMYIFLGFPRRPNTAGALPGTGQILSAFFLSVSLSLISCFFFYCWMLAASCLRHDTLRCFQDKVANLFQLFFKSNRGEVDIFYRELHSFFPCVLYDWRSIFGVCVWEAPSLSHRPRPDSLFSISSFSLLFLCSAPPFSTRFFFLCGVNPPDVEAWSSIALSATGNPRKERIEIIYLRKSTRLHLCFPSDVA